MKTFARFALLAGLGLASSLLSGCTATPAYSGEERAVQIQHNWDYEYSQIADDTDYILMLRPQGTLSYWNVYHRN